MKEPVIIRISAEPHIIQSRQAARALAQAIGFNQLDTSYIVTSVSELASNLFRHAAGGGVITLAVLNQARVGVKVIAEDDGPGISDVEAAMQDAFSTKGGIGKGLPGVKRMMDEFEITSKVGVGTRVVSRKWKK
jgi:serine/threonine-protein kinase RsbT